MATASATRLVLLGTAGGPLPSLVRSGIAQAVVVGDRPYLIDCGSSVTLQLRRARLLSKLHQVFVTHLHSDHCCDLFNIFLLGWPITQWNPPVTVYGPGPAGGAAALPPDHPQQPPVPLINPPAPTPGLSDLIARQFEAHAYDINIRMRDSGRADLTELVVGRDIALPPGVGGSGPYAVAPPMDPFVVAEDDAVRVSAVLVPHAPVFPAFAFRFDTDAGSIVISGDTAPSENLVALAQGADILVHEVFDDSQHALDEETFEAKQRQQHLLSSHTPMSAVGKVAADAGVRRLVLTHFVPGDDAMPDDHWLDGIGDAFGGEVVVGRDLMEIAL